MSESNNKIEPPGVRAQRLQIERSAIEEVWCDWSRRDRPYGASEGEIELSKAVSLKRIADALEGFDPTAFRNQLLDIAYQAGVNFRGRQ